MASDIVVPFLGALQASIAVLLTIGVGVIASQFQLISEKSSKEISKAAVRLFLPALLIVNVGEQLHASTVRLPMPGSLGDLMQLVQGRNQNRANGNMSRPSAMFPYSSGRSFTRSVLSC